MAVVSHFVVRACHSCVGLYFFFFFFNDTATTEIYTLSLHDALPILRTINFSPALPDRRGSSACRSKMPRPAPSACRDRKSTRLNSSHANISYAVFCLKKKKNVLCMRPPTRHHARPTHNTRSASTAVI